MSFNQDSDLITAQKLLMNFSCLLLVDLSLSWLSWISFNIIDHQIIDSLEQVVVEEQS